MVDASNIGVKVFEEAIPVQPETAKICSHFQIDPLQLIGSGALIVSAEAERASQIVTSLKLERIQASIIGEFTENAEQRELIQKGDVTNVLPRPPSDNLWTALKQ